MTLAETVHSNRVLVDTYESGASDAPLSPLNLAAKKDFPTLPRVPRFLHR